MKIDKNLWTNFIKKLIANKIVLRYIDLINQKIKIYLCINLIRQRFME